MPSFFHILPLLLIHLSTPDPRSVTSPGPGAEDRVLPLGPQALESLVKDRKGKALLLNVWATWCIPCVEEFPDLERVYRRYGDEGLDVAVVSIDFDDEVDSKVVPFLKKMRATMPAYINAFDRPIDLIETLDPVWSGAVPATFVYDSRGELIHTVVGKQTLGQFEKLVTDVLKKQGSGKP